MPRARTVSSWCSHRAGYQEPCPAVDAELLEKREQVAIELESGREVRATVSLERRERRRCERLFSLGEDCATIRDRGRVPFETSRSGLDALGDGLAERMQATTCHRGNVDEIDIETVADERQGRQKEPLNVPHQAQHGVTRGQRFRKTGARLVARLVVQP